MRRFTWEEVRERIESIRVFGEGREEVVSRVERRERIRS